ncbi:hypothetical protein ANN_12416 [Periplaneta americana]|uniref:Mos1 transposase HTH domain-containing protein n=1 Tax=Periplaneta americana TaxID=6978 RepID=A0ABQ8THW4_PERAM|nr:hypothetical protein ANN_12416 [Periplaneta americana]
MYSHNVVSTGCNKSPLCILCYFKMNDVIDNPADCEVRSVIRFLNARHLKPAEIYRQLKEVYGDTVMNERNVRKWCEMFNNGRTNVHDETRPGRPSLITEDLKTKVNDRILQDRRTSLDELLKDFLGVSVEKTPPPPPESGTELQHSKTMYVDYEDLLSIVSAERTGTASVSVICERVGLYSSLRRNPSCHRSRNSLKTLDTQVSVCIWVLRLPGSALRHAQQGPNYVLETPEFDLNLHGNVCKMVDNDGSFRQRAVIKFLVKEEKSAAEIHLRLQRAYGDVCMGASSVRRWVEHFEDGNTSIQDERRSGRPRTASTERNKKDPDLAPSDYDLFGSVKEQLRGQRYETLEDTRKALVLNKLSAEYEPENRRSNSKQHKKSKEDELVNSKCDSRARGQLRILEMYYKQ